MGILSDLLAQYPGGVLPNGEMIEADPSQMTIGPDGQEVPSRFTIFNPNGPQGAGTPYPIFDDTSGQQVSTGQFDSGNISFGDVLQGAEFIGGAAVGGEALFGGLGAAEGAGMAGDAGLSSDIGNLGAEAVSDGSFDPSLFSFGSDSSSSSLLSSLGSSLSGGGTGFNQLMPFLSQLISGVNAKQAGSTANDLANRLIAASDPFAPYRAGYGQKLQALESSKDVTSIPGYQAGLQAVERSGAAQGFTGSGNMMKSLQDFGGNFYNAELQRLAGLAGAGATPGAGLAQGASIISQGLGSSQFGNNQLLQSFGSLLNSGILSPGNASIGAGASSAIAGNPLDIGSLAEDAFAG